MCSWYYHLQDSLQTSTEPATSASWELGVPARRLDIHEGPQHPTIQDNQCHSIHNSYYKNMHLATSATTTAKLGCCWLTWESYNNGGITAAPEPHLTTAYTACSMPLHPECL
jgi:hypothetical protein